jgi:magnesium chelatase subunit D
MTHAPAAASASGGYPFAALVGQEPMKLALILAGIDLNLGGVLLRGEKGTAKSTAARGLARLLPPLAVVAGCPWGCDPDGPLCPRCQARTRPLTQILIPTPFVDLPLGASEDRLLGSLDLEAAVAQGRQEPRPGLLARAHRGVLYVDEINLLPLHLAHLLLDSAASGQARLEREGLSHAYPARFALIASYNPEEGPLGPQILDRFGLCVEVAAEADPAQRVEVLKRRLAFEADPAAFARAWDPRQAELAARLARARENLLAVEVTDNARAEAARQAALARSQGQRGELAIARAARAMAAWQGLSRAGREQVRQVAPLALLHRATASPPTPDQPLSRLRGAPLPREDDTPPAQAARQANPDQTGHPDQAGHQPGQECGLYILAPGPVKPVATRLPAKEGASQKQAGRRQARQVVGNRGRYLRASAKRLGRSLAFDATFRAAAPHQIARRHPGGPALVVLKSDLREKVRAARRGRLLIFCVDASGSMNAAARMQETKAAVLGLLTEAYQKRDRVGVVTFGGLSAREILPPTASVEVARRLLAELPTGGKTPLAAGLVLLAQALGREISQDPKVRPLVVILSDGRPNVPLRVSFEGQDLSLAAGDKGGGWGDNWGDGGYADREVLNLARRLGQEGRARFVVVDTDVGHHHEINLCQALAQYLGAACVSLRTITAGQVLDLVKQNW